jgi:hypothetical protein
MINLEIQSCRRASILELEVFRDQVNEGIDGVVVLGFWCNVTRIVSATLGSAFRQRTYTKAVVISTVAVTLDRAPNLKLSIPVFEVLEEVSLTGDAELNDLTWRAIHLLTDKFRKQSVVLYDTYVCFFERDCNPSRSKWKRTST